jgi:exonuclease SbcC
MRLRYMELRNYRKFRSAAIEFPDGVVAIIGPNGAGKTTLLEAVTWALFGNESTVVRDGKEGVMSAGTSLGEECSVVLEFDLGGDGYRLVRSMKGKLLKVDASLEANGELVAKGDSAVTGAVVRLLGMDHRAFFVSVFAKQKDLNALANLRPAERKKLVLRMLGVDFLESVTKLVDHDASAAKREADQLSSLLKDQEGRDKETLLKEERRLRTEALTVMERSLSQMRVGHLDVAKAAQEAKGRWEAEEERYRKDVALQQELTGLRGKLQGRNERLTGLEREIEELQGLEATLPRLREGEGKYQTAKEALEGMNALRERHLGRQRVVEDLASRESELLSLRRERERTAQELSRLPDVEGSLGRVEESLEQTRELASSIATQVSLAEAEAHRLGRSLNELEGRMEELSTLGEDSNCPTCQRRMGGQYAELLRRYGEDREALKEDLSKQRGVQQELGEQRERNERRRKVLEDRRRELASQSRTRASLEERVAGAGRSIAEAERKAAVLRQELSALGEVDYQPTRHEALRCKVNELEREHLALSRAEARVERLPQAMREREEQTEARSNEEARVRALSQEREELGFDPRVLKERRQEHEEAREREEALCKDIIRAEGERGRLISELQGLGERMGELHGIRERHAEHRAEQELLNRLGQVMKGFKENVVSRITPTLSQVSSDLLTQLTDGKYGGIRLDEDYQMYLYDQGEEHSLERFSGGEVDLANLCLRLAISHMIMDRSGSQMNFLVLDEIFGSQDQNRKRNILETLAQLQRQFRQILLITHIDDVKDNVSAVLKVAEREDGSSTVALED